MTPFTLLCPSCDGLLEHSDWEKYERATDHKPRGGQLVFRDGTSAPKQWIIMRLTDSVDSPRFACPRHDQERLDLQG